MADRNAAAEQQSLVAKQQKNEVTAQKSEAAGYGKTEAQMERQIVFVVAGAKLGSSAERLEVFEKIELEVRKEFVAEIAVGLGLI